MALQIRLAYWTVGTEAEPIFPPKEFAELESILWLLSFYRLRIRRGRWYGVHNFSHRGAL
jgi:hypothetical protein